MYISFVQEHILNSQSPYHNKVRFYRIEYGGSNEDSIMTKSIMMPYDVTQQELDALKIVLKRIPDIKV